MEDKKCVSCKKKVENDKGSVLFNCPNCGKQEMVRCEECRKKAVKYKCIACEFEGPN